MPRQGTQGRDGLRRCRQSHLRKGRAWWGTQFRVAGVVGNATQGGEKQLRAGKSNSGRGKATQALRPCLRAGKNNSGSIGVFPRPLLVRWYGADAVRCPFSLFFAFFFGTNRAMAAPASVSRARHRLGPGRAQSAGHLRRGETHDPEHGNFH